MYIKINIELPEGMERGVNSEVPAEILREIRIQRAIVEALSNRAKQEEMHISKLQWQLSEAVASEQYTKEAIAEELNAYRARHEAQ